VADAFIYFRRHPVTSEIGEGRDLLLSKLKERAAALKREVFALYFAAGDPRVPWYARAFMGLVLAYAFSPIDLIPDFIPVLGYLDDLIIVPLGVALALKMVPAQVMQDARKQVDALAQQGKPVSRIGAILVVAIWVILAGVMIGFIVHAFMK
jgi:uncharacterized membrane protein YkvA (DUF1232 family)